MRADVVTARAVAPLDRLAELAVGRYGQGEWCSQSRGEPLRKS